jgi:hypothetical protein
VAELESSPAAASDRRPEAGDGQTVVTISRQHDEDVRQRQILVRIDDGPVSTLMFGERVTLDVAPGAHTLRANNTLFWKTQPFSVARGEHLEFVVVNRAGRMTLSFLTVMGVAPLFLSIERRGLA